MSTENVNDDHPNQDNDANVARYPDLCIHCQEDPCVAVGLSSMLNTIQYTYMGWKTNKQVRFIMYTECVKSIHGPCLGKGVRRKLPKCLQQKIRILAPDDKYTGFKESKYDE